MEESLESSHTRLQDELGKKRRLDYFWSHSCNGFRYSPEHLCAEHWEKGTTLDFRLGDVGLEKTIPSAPSMTSRLDENSAVSLTFGYLFSVLCKAICFRSKGLPDYKRSGSDKYSSCHWPALRWDTGIWGKLNEINSKILGFIVQENPDQLHMFCGNPNNNTKICCLLFVLWMRQQISF